MKIPHYYPKTNLSSFKNWHYDPSHSATHYVVVVIALLFSTFIVGYYGSAKANTPLDPTPRIMYWYGKVNQHVDASGVWQTDSDGTSGANIDKLTYCKKFFPTTTSVTPYKQETISTWHDAHNINSYVGTVTSDKCVSDTSTSDTIAPTISIVAPTSNASVSGAFSISANASDNIAVTKVEFYKDSDTTPFATDTSFPYTTSLNASNLSAGTHTITARAYDQAGNSSSASVSITIGNITVGPLDPTPRIMYWYGKVNQHVDASGVWQTDSDGTSGANIDKLTYCKKFFPTTTSVTPYKQETISTWHDAHNINSYVGTVTSDKCVSGSIVLQSMPETGDEFVGPFPSWINVKTEYGAVGDGVTDDTAALQAAFDAIPNKGIVAYLPAGTYRITQTLKMNFKDRIAIIGQDPSNTTIIWDGVSGGTMIGINGTAYSRFNRITWNGNKLAWAAVDQSWDGSKPNFDTGNEYADDVFVDVGIGIQGGFKGHGFAETSILRDKFIRNTTAGVSLGNFNALDTWIWNSYFEDCKIGVTNIYGAGDFFVYGSVFRGSKIADMRTANTELFAARDNTSIDSASFYIAGWSRNPSPIIFQGNTIIDPVNTAISIQNQGPITLMDNVFRSRAGTTGSVVYAVPSSTNELIAVDNTFTKANPIQAGGSTRKAEFGTKVVSVSSLKNLSTPVEPITQPSFGRKVFEVPLYSTSTTIQPIINEAMAYNGSRPIVHFPRGNYNLSTTLVIPKGSDVQLVGDDFGTGLNWVGTGIGPMIKFYGPTKATVRNMTLNGHKIADGILVTNADQRGSRIYSDDLDVRTTVASNVFIDGLDNTQVLLTDGIYTYNTSGVGIKVVGGPKSAFGLPHDGKNVIYLGTGSSNVPHTQISSGGNLHIRDYWYENNFMAPFANLFGTSTFTMEGTRVFSPQNTSTPIFNIKDFIGKATFLNSKITDRISVSGSGALAKVLNLGSAMQDKTPFLEDTSNPSADARMLLSREMTTRVAAEGGSIAAANIGSVDEQFIRDMLASIREIHSPVLTPLPSDVTDFRLFRVWVDDAVNGLHITASNF